ncbi:macrophage mannose receptor 1-like [Ostrinia furnacalis]|uniref:macrophage mannose receptor 1-like n=1 Tax=Ostrinia furnacalis TaxID=93504 RepID=UPI00103D9345|nr:macrophage mannose receptor 1-like [Ostrinia furnacalis]
MFRQTLFISLLFFLVVKISHSQREKKFFRKDYKYIEATESFYKIHTIHKTWQDAKDVCAMEGATFFVPEDQGEADAVLAFWNATQPYSWVYIGVSSLIVKGVFETVEGQPISDVYSNWGPGEPNDANGEEDCVILRRDGTLNDVNCVNKYPFVCKKTLDSLEWNIKCDMPNMDYVFNEALGKCYKFHLDPRTWREAYAVCSAESSYLAIIDSQAEADHLVKITAEAPKDDVQGDFLRGAVHLGFHKRKDGWKTIRGTKLENSGYSKWGNQQPDGGDNETCGTMFYNGHLNDLKCDHKCFFICEHDVGSLSNSLDFKFGDDE